MQMPHKNSFMKKNYLSLIFSLLAFLFWSCNGSNTSTSSSDSTSAAKTTSADTSTNTPNNTPANSTASTNLPLSKSDSTFVMKAAAGGLMEVELGSVAQQNAVNARVKN